MQLIKQLPPRASLANCTQWERDYDNAMRELNKEFPGDGHKPNLPPELYPDVNGPPPRGGSGVPFLREGKEKYGGNRPMPRTPRPNITPSPRKSK